ncbi:hypothetical protein GUITHDRAFT_151406 [Guillardia theta CCMP2712]|uniref:Adenosylmethionine decarboxylase n=2 Tax=Guillardia theta TaxID=55529 RepID=L1JMA4_GUITC|nr:hypothetical protein GUITHDRAFT_151406 [Guillardia theta CCMP2712]EKX49567.1 hypothetical protein GUITHDRAFT_151406 [Guillardia theta CCMP2712]|eukprot:XP_005836547.1 hypothetical protein GUITHDRAFT_151406 [Guillardia theta CCMP2712]
MPEIIETNQLFCFEGSEKKMEIDFRPIDGGDTDTIDINGGLRQYNREFWSDIVAILNGTILLADPQEKFDAYLISESSLFVYNDRVIILTCGTTLLLKTLPAIMKAGADVGLEVCWFQYSRKNFLFPEQQSFPHTSFDQEVHFLHEYFPTGRPFIMGPLSSDHWYLFVADFIRRETPDGSRKIVDRDQMLNIYMYGIDPQVAQYFMKADPLIIPSIFEDFSADSNNVEKEQTKELGNQSEFCATGDEASDRSGISSLLEHDGKVVHSHLFEPCGYSMNGQAADGSSYWTIHITPEAHCSYASFETNFSCDSYHHLIARVLEVFRPAKFTTVEHVDADSRIGIAGPVCPASLDGYDLAGRTFNEFGTKDYVVQMCNYVSKTAQYVAPPPPLLRAPPLHKSDSGEWSK